MLRLDRNTAFITAMGDKPKPVPGVDQRTATHEQVVDLLMDHLEVDLPNHPRVDTIPLVRPSARLATHVPNPAPPQFTIAPPQPQSNAASYAPNHHQNRAAQPSHYLYHTTNQPTPTHRNSNRPTTSTA